MCTVTIVPAGDRLRLMCNRDERHDRAEAHPPLVARAGGQLALMPLDAPGAGTWCAVNASGLVFALLNDDGPHPARSESRGRIIVELLDCATLTHAVERAGALYARPWAPHRLIVTDGRGVVQLRGGRGVPTVDTWAARRPMMFTSSSLGTTAVHQVRTALFDRTVGAAFAAGHAHDAWSAQEAFHRHRWPDRPQVSVHMRRHDAATQSITTVHVTPRHVSMRYEPRDAVGVAAPLSLERRAPGARASFEAPSAGTASAAMAS